MLWKDVGGYSERCFLALSLAFKAPMHGDAVMGVIIVDEMQDTIVCPFQGRHLSFLLIIGEEESG